MNEKGRGLLTPFLGNLIAKPYWRILEQSWTLVGLFSFKRLPAPML
jgi:hypothetical protein